MDRLGRSGLGSVARRQRSFEELAWEACAWAEGEPDDLSDEDEGSFDADRFWYTPDIAEWERSSRDGRAVSRPSGSAIEPAFGIPIGSTLHIEAAVQRGSHAVAVREPHGTPATGTHWPPVTATRLAPTVPFRVPPSAEPVGADAPAKHRALQEAVASHSAPPASPAPARLRVTQAVVSHPTAKASNALSTPAASPPTAALNQLARMLGRSWARDRRVRMGEGLGGGLRVWRGL